MGTLTTTIPASEPGDSGTFKPYRLGDFTVTTPLTSDRSGFSQWGFCRKDGKEYFLKKFLAPVYPLASIPLSEEQRGRRIGQCERWVAEKSALYSRIVRSQTGNLVVPLRLFRVDSHYYLVTERIQTNGMALEQVSTLTPEQKLIIMKVLANSFARLAANGVVHADVKPENLLIKQTGSGFFTVKVIDFDASYIEGNPPEPDELQGDPVYYAPETFLYMAEEPALLTPKVDVFAMGIIFHVLLCGKRPEISGPEDGEQYLYEAALEGAQILLHPSLTPPMKTLIGGMLQTEAENRLSMQQVLEQLNAMDPAAKSARESRWRKAADFD